MYQYTKGAIKFPGCGNYYRVYKLISIIYKKNNYIIVSYLGGKNHGIFNR